MGAMSLAKVGATTASAAEALEKVRNEPSASALAHNPPRDPVTAMTGSFLQEV
jgi:hypothetical protein